MGLEKLVKSVFHPNRLSAYGLGLTVAGMGLMADSSTDIYGAVMVAGGYALDYLDGRIARQYGLRTLEGAKLDPLIDKSKNFAIGTHIMIKELMMNNFVLPVVIGCNWIVDYISQRARGSFLKQIKNSIYAVINPKACEKDTEENSHIRANVYGKTKMVLQVGAMLSYLAYKLHQNHLEQFSQENGEYFKKTLAGVLVASAVLGGIGVYKRWKIKKIKNKELKNKKLDNKNEK